MDRIIYFVVGDKGLNSGNGIYVKDLEEMKARLLRMQPKGEWQLVISIHGAENMIATQGGYLRNPQAQGTYRAEDIRRLFGNDPAVKRWRDSYGPTWTTLNACQVNHPFEAVIVESFNKPNAQQKAQGLGQGCRPLTMIMQYEREGSKTPVTTRAQWSQLPESEKKALQSMLSELNRKFGYFGGPPVPETHLLSYYFDEEPKGGWPVVTVSVNKKDTGISFYNRTQNTRFLSQVCKEHMGPMRPHIPGGPD